MAANNSNDMLQKITKSMEDFIQNMELAHDEKLHLLEKTHQKELDKLIKSHSDEINKIESKLVSFNQTDDLIKFQKKTIDALKAEIADMQSSIISLEKRLSHADKEIQKQQLLTEKAPIINDTISLNTFKPNIKHENNDASSSKEAELPELYPISLKSGTYYCDAKTNELYEFISEEEAGEVIAVLKTVKIKSTIYYLDLIDNNFYINNDDNTVGDHAGQVVNRKAIFKSVKH